MLNIIDHIFLIHSLVDKHVDWFQFLTIVKRAAQRWKTTCLNNSILWLSFGCVFRGGGSGPMENMILGF